MSVDILTLAAACKKVGSPTGEQVNAAVDRYLTNHPVQPYDDTELRAETAALKKTKVE